MAKVKLTVHTSAEENFNKEALSLLALCKESKYAQQNRQSKTNFPDPVISATLTNKDISSIEMGMKNGFGEETGKYFAYNNKQIGLEDEDYKKLIKLCESIQKAIKPSTIISRNAIVNQCFCWLRDRFSDRTNANLIEYILPNLEDKVEELEIWLPVSGFLLEDTIQIGKVHFRPITKELLDGWLVPLLSKNSNENSKFMTEFFDKKVRKPFQGFPASYIKLSAEQELAREIAIYETNRSLAMLRLFTPAAVTPKVNCHIAMVGQENIDTRIILTFKNGMFSGLTENIVGNSHAPLPFRNIDITQFRKSGLASLSDLLCKDNLTGFEEDILDSFLLYSNATKEKELANKIIYILASLESIFLKNENEPIQQNLGERIATLIGRDLGEKKEIIKNVKSVYATRSAFVHHANSITQYEELEKFMFTSFKVLMTVLQNCNKFKSRDEFVTAIDDRKLS